MKKLILILIILMAFIIPAESQCSFLDFEGEALSNLSYQYWYDTKEGIVKIEFVTNLKDKDQIACAEVVDAKIGDTFTGLSGITYVLQEQTILTPIQIEYLANQDILVVGEWVPVDEANSIVDTSDLQNAFKRFHKQYYTGLEHTLFTETELTPTLEDISWSWVEGVGYIGSVVEEEL